MNKTIRTAVSLACLAAIAPTTAYADIDNKKSKEIQEIVVTAKGGQSLDELLHTAHVFTQLDIENAQAKSIPALLERIAGISARDSGGRGSQTTIFIRGVSASQTIVLIDGVRVGSATLGAAALNAFPIEAIERIEILKGPFSGIYGADAVGGVIQLFTKKGQSNEKVMSVSGGSDGLQEASLSLGFAGERGSFNLSAQTEESDGIDRTSILTGGNDDKDAYEETAFGFGGQYYLGDKTIAKLNILSTENTVEFDNLFGEGVGHQTENDTLSVAFSVTHEFNDALSWTTTLGTNEDESVTVSSFPSTFLTNRDTLGSELNYAISEVTTLTTGVDYYEENIEATADYASTTRDNKAVYAQLQTQIANIDTVLSLRSDDNSAYGSETNGSFAVGYQLSDSLRASASFGTAFVAPSFNYLYYRGFGNPEILPEESNNYEVSLIGEQATFEWRVSAYKTEVENLFSFDPNTFLAANVGEAELTGLEFAATASLSDWNLGLQADLLDAVDKVSGENLDDRAEKSLSLNAAKSFDKLDLSFDLRAESGRFDRGGTQLSGYGLFDVAAVYRFNDHFSASANIDNLFDKDYTVNLASATERYNTEGRQIKLSVRYAF